MTTRAIALALAVLAGGCTFTWGRSRNPCVHPVARTVADLVVGVGAAGTGAVAVYPCGFVDDQSDRARAIHCGTAAAGAAIGAAFIASGLRGLDQVQRCPD